MYGAGHVHNEDRGFGIPTPGTTPACTTSPDARVVSTVWVYYMLTTLGTGLQEHTLDSVILGHPVTSVLLSSPSYRLRN